MKTPFILLAVLLINLQLTITPALSQTKVKFGKVSKQELEMKVYEKDTNAVAVILYDSGQSYFDYENNDTNSGFICKFERHVRIKILKSEGFDYGTFEIPIYHDKYGKEEVTLLKARTYNLEDKIIDTKLEKNQIFREETSPSWNTIKYSMPNIKVGSIIDCKYTIKSPFYHNFRTWKFQYNIPVVYSKYRTKILEYFNYQKTIKGYHQVNKVKFDQRQETINVEVKKMSTNVGDPRMIRHKFTLTPQAEITEYWAEDIPAFKGESYMLAKKNYLSRVEFELESYQIESGQLHRYSSSWETVKNKLMKAERFGQAITKIGFAEKIITNHIKSEDSTDVKIAKLYQLVQNSIQWNGKNRLFCSSSLKNIWKNKKGNSADINLLLINFLRAANIKANPVVLSTRQNGLIHPSHPTITQMNYVVACVEVDNSKFLLDATDPFLPVGILPFRCLNEKGRMISTNRNEWVSLSPRKGSKINLIANLKLTENGDLKGTVKEVFQDYASIEMRKEIGSNQDEFLSKLESEYEEWNITDPKLINCDNKYKPLILTYSSDMKNIVNLKNDQTYLNPILKYKTAENPFKLEKRDYPVHFGHPININYRMILELPEGFSIDKQPKGAMVKLPEKSAFYSYRISQAGNKIMANFNFTINKIHFNPAEYSTIKEFYNQIISNENQILTIKKIPATAVK